MFKLIKIQLEFFASMQTLFPCLKIDIFCRIAPLSFIKLLNPSIPKAQERKHFHGKKNSVLFVVIC